MEAMQADTILVLSARLVNVAGKRFGNQRSRLEPQVEARKGRAGQRTKLGSFQRLVSAYLLYTG